MKTPLGRFRIAEKIGDNLPIDIAFKSRQPVRASREDLQSEDLIMSRILWLEGLEESNANSHARYIYLHGTNHEETIGQPASHGCIRMRKADVAELFAAVEEGTPVFISEKTPVRGRGRKGEKSVARGFRRD